MNEVNNIPDVEKINFFDRFLSKFLENGFGTLPKREIEILIFHLLYNESTFIEDKTNYEMANLLKISESKIKSLKADADLKYQRTNNKEALQHIAEMIFSTQQAHPEIDGDYIQFSLEDPVLTREFSHAVKQLGYATDSSFNSEIIRVNASVFLNVFIDNFESVEKKFIEIVKKEIKNQDEFQTILNKTIPGKKRFKLFLQKIEEPIYSILGEVIGVIITSQIF